MKEFIDVVALGALLGVGWYLGSNLTDIVFRFAEKKIQRLFLKIKTGV